MTSWNEPRYQPRTSSRILRPGIFVNVEFGVSFGNRERPHIAFMKYASKNMKQRLAQQRRQQNEYLLQPRNNHQSLSHSQMDGQHPTSLIPPSYQPNERPSRQHPQHRPGRLLVQTRDLHSERGSSALPTLSDRTQAISPISPTVSPGIHHTSSLPLESDTGFYERALPEIPSRFRLGEDGLPWSTEPWYISPEPYASPTLVGIELQNARGEDPQRVRDLEALHLAMMTVDSLPPGHEHDGWETWTWDSLADVPRATRSIEWAVGTDEVHSNFGPGTGGYLEPPPYEVRNGAGMRSRSSR